MTLIQPLISSANDSESGRIETSLQNDRFLHSTPTYDLFYLCHFLWSTAIVKIYQDEANQRNTYGADAQHGRLLRHRSKHQWMHRWSETNSTQSKGFRMLRQLCDLCQAMETWSLQWSLVCKWLRTATRGRSQRGTRSGLQYDQILQRHNISQFE